VKLERRDHSASVTGCLTHDLIHTVRALGATLAERVLGEAAEQAAAGCSQAAGLGVDGIKKLVGQGDHYLCHGVQYTR
jgi:hypothetical protein